MIDLSTTNLLLFGIFILLFIITIIISVVSFIHIRTLLDFKDFMKSVEGDYTMVKTKAINILKVPLGILNFFSQK